MKKLILSFILASIFVTNVEAQTFVRLWPGVRKGTIDATDDVVTSPSIRGAGSVTVGVAGTFSGVITLSCKMDEDDYDDLTVTSLINPSTTASTITAEGKYTANIAGCDVIKATGSAWVSGEAEVTLVATQSGTSGSSMSIAGVTLSSGRIPVLADCNNCGAVTGINSAIVEGPLEHDAVMASTIRPLTSGGYASATAPTDVSASGDAVRAWHLLNGSQVVALQSGGTLITGNSSGLEVQGGLAHDDVDAGNPMLAGFRAIAHGTNPTAVAAADRTVGYANRAGVPFMIGGHPNVITLESQVEDGDGAQTNAAIVTVGAGSKIVVTQVLANCDASNTNPTNIVAGFAAATLPSRAHGGAAGILAAFDGVPAGGGMSRGNGSGIIGVGADGEDLRITTEDPAGGACSITVSYFTIES